MIRYPFLLFIILGLFTTKLMAQPLSPVVPKQEMQTHLTPETFGWNLEENATSYTFELSADSLFSTLIHSENTNSNILNYSGSLSNNTYYWRLTAHFLAQTDKTSQTHKFTIFSPAGNPNLKLWLAADTGVVITSGAISQWNDLSGNNFHLTQATAGNRPILQNNAIGNKPAVKFDGINDFMRVDFGQLFAQPNTYFIVWNVTNYTGNSHHAFTGLDLTNRNAFIFSDASKNMSIAAPTFVALYQQTDSIFPFILNTCIFNSSASQLYENSIFKGSGNTGNAAISGLTIGGSTHTPINNPLNGNIAEFIFIDTLLDISTKNQFENFLINKYSPSVSLGYDIKIPYLLCDTIFHGADKPWFTKWLWNTGDTTSTIRINESGEYWVEATNIFGLVSTDTINVYYAGQQSFSDSILCLGDTLNYEYSKDFPYTFLWSNGDTSRYFTSSDAGMHSLEITDSLGCSYKTYFNLELDSLSAKMSLGDDRALCTGEELFPTFGDLPNQNYHYLWMDNDTDSSITIQNAGEFSLQVSNERGCVAYDTVQITLQGVKPIADFEALGVCFGNETPFTDASSSPDGSDIISWEWDFGDSLFANTQNPQHTYLESGIYPVKLRITTENLCAAETQSQIAVYSLPQAHFSPLTACAQSPLSFVDQSYSEYQIENWNWSFNDSNSSSQNSDLQNPIHLFDSAGTYMVELIVNHVFGCSDTLIQVLEIRPSAMADFNTNTACDGNTTWFNSSTVVNSWNPIVSYHWEYANLFNDSLAVSSFRFDTAGIYPVKHSIKLLNGCQSEITKNVKVAPNPNALFLNPESCLNTPYLISDQSSIPSDSIVSVRWFINNQFYAVSNQIEINFPQADTFQIKQIVTSNENCSDTLILPVVIHPIPNANFSLEYDDQSIGNQIIFTNTSTEALSYFWDFGNGSVSTQNSPSMDFPLEGSYTIYLVATNEHLCSDTTSKIINIANPSMDLHLLEADFVHQDNYVSTNIRFANLGNRPVFSLWLDSKINDKTGREKWIGILHPGEIIEYNLHSKSYLPSYQSIDYACINISSEDYPIERDLSNNTICFSKNEEFMLHELFPNPGQDKITLMLSAPSDNTSEILIYYPDGRTAHTPIQKSLKKGINQIQLPIQNLEAGIYLVQIRFEEKVISRKFVVLK